ncbi:MAG: hypothetical protein ABSD68_00740 [Candidatus Micrarchaeales archaeon]
MVHREAKYTQKKLAVSEEMFMKLVDDAGNIARTPEGVMALGKIKREGQPNNDNYTALHWALSNSSCSRDPKKMKLAESILLDPKKREIAARVLDGKHSAAASGLNEAIRDELNSTRSGRMFLTDNDLQIRQPDARSVGRLLKTIEDEKLREAVKKCAAGRDYGIQERIIDDIKEASNQLRRETIMQAIALIDSFDEDSMAANVADRMRRRAPYIRGETETEMLTNLTSLFSTYPKSVAAELFDVWSEVAYRSDWGDPEGALHVIKIMQKKEVVEAVNSFSSTLMPAIAAHLARITDCMQDEECVVSASKAIAKEMNSEKALKQVRYLEEKAKSLGNEDSMGFGWGAPSSENKRAFIKEIETIVSN